MQCTREKVFRAVIFLGKGREGQHQLRQSQGTMLYYKKQGEYMENRGKAVI